jgi:hypothetical protein
MEKENDMNAVSPSILEGLIVGIMAIAMLVAIGVAIWFTATGNKPKASHSNRPKASSKPDIHDVIEPYAKNVKIVLQMFIGFIVVCLIILRAFSALYPGVASNPSNPFPFAMNLVSNVWPLDIVGVALAFSTAVELAYSLFTRGLDEAIKPLITGIAAAILIAISPPQNFKLEVISAVALAVVALAILFLIERTLPSEETTGGAPLRKQLEEFRNAIASFFSRDHSTSVNVQNANKPASPALDEKVPTQEYLANDKIPLLEQQPGKH